MSWLARLVPFQYYIATALALGLIGWGASAEWRLHTSEAREADAKATLEQERSAYAKAALAATTANRTEEQRRAAAQQETVNAAIEKATLVAADAAAAHDAAGRLLQRIDALVAGSRPSPGHPQVAATSASASGSGLVLAKLFSSVDEAAGRYAALADERGIAGDACVQAYDSLTK